MLAAFLATTLFAFSTICGHRSARLIGGAEANFWRITVAAVLLGLWSFLTGIGLNGAGFMLFFVSGLIGIGIGDVAWFQALPRLGPRVSSLLVQCLTAPFGALIEWLWMGTRLTVTQMFSGMLIIGGLALALKPGEHLRWRQPGILPGFASCAIAAFCTALGAVFSRKGYQVTAAAGESIDALNAGFQRIAGGLVLAGVFLLLSKRQVWRIQHGATHAMIVSASKHKWKGVWIWVLLNGLSGQTLGVSCMQWSLETTPTGVVLAVISTAPILVIPLAAIFEGERPTARAIIGAAIGVAGVIGLTILK